MPKYLPKSNKQHTAEEANESRLVTKTRWIVEARNGHVKLKFKFFRDTIPMQHVRHIGDFFRIACAIINAYSPPIIMQNANSELAKSMLDLAKTPNVVQAKVEEMGLEKVKRTDWIPMTAEGHLPGFPVLTEDYLRDLTVGVYQLKLAKSYVEDKVRRESEYTLDVLLDEPGLIRVRIYSRFTNSTKYFLWISYVDSSYDAAGDPDKENPILGWYCKCKTGARTLGCCAHVASVLWYLGFARHQEKIKYPSTQLLGVFKDAGDRELPIIHETAEQNLPGPLEGIEFEPDL